LAALIPAIGTCVSRMTGGERRLAYRLELKLVAQMVNPGTNSLLVLYDDAQSIYGREKRGKLSFKSLGIQAQGRTTILKINYRNTQEVLELASGIASDLLKPSASDEDGVPLVAPISAGRHGPKPLLIEAAQHPGRSRLHRQAPQGSPQNRHPMERHGRHLPRLRHRQAGTRHAKESRHPGDHVPGRHHLRGKGRHREVPDHA
jgi:hypothetical protein